MSGGKGGKEKEEEKRRAKVVNGISRWNKETSRVLRVYRLEKWLFYEHNGISEVVTRECKLAG